VSSIGGRSQRPEGTGAAIFESAAAFPQEEFAADIRGSHPYSNASGSAASEQRTSRD